MVRWRLALLLVSLVALSSASAGAGSVRAAAQTKREAEVNTLSVVAHKWKAWMKFGLVDTRTHLLKNNTEAVCSGRRSRRAGNGYSRFVCVVRPQTHRPHQGLWLAYRALSQGGCQIRILAYRRG
jgi:hypothetical protein